MNIFQCQNLQVSQGRVLLLGKLSLVVNVNVWRRYGGCATTPLHNIKIDIVKETYCCFIWQFQVYCILNRQHSQKCQLV